MRSYEDFEQRAWAECEEEPFDSVRRRGRIECGLP